MNLAIEYEFQVKFLKMLIYIIKILFVMVINYPQIITSNIIPVF